MSWATVPFQSLYAEPSRNGLNRPSYMRGTGFKMVNMGELFAYDRIFNQEMELVPLNDREIYDYALQQGDLLFARQSLVLEGAGKCSIVQEVNDFIVFESHLIRVRLNKSICNPNFYFYYFRSKISPIRAIVQQCAQAGVRSSDLAKLKVINPPLEIQFRISNILSAYDDLIENNRRRIQLLEQSARLLYREWFVHLRFPGHEHVSVVDGVPEGWSFKTLNELADLVTYGYTASADDLPVGPKFLRITDIVPDILDWSTVPYCQISDGDLAKFSLQEGDVVIARTGATVGYAKRIGRMEYPSVFASYLVRLRFSKEIDDMVAGIFIESLDYKNFVRSNCGGAAQPNANAKVLSSARLLVPPKRLQMEFRQYIEPSFKQRDVLQQQVLKLQQARDLLLSRLMNGEFVV